MVKAVTNNYYDTRFFVVVFVYSALLTMLSIYFGMFKIALVLLPFPFIIFNITVFRVLVFYFMGVVIFFDAYTTSVFFFMIPETILLLFIGARLFLSQNTFTLKVPFSKTLLIMYVIVIYVVVLSIPNLLSLGVGVKGGVLNDLKNGLYFCVLPLIFVEFFSFKKCIHIFLCITLFSSINAVFSIVSFIILPHRIVIWNEIYYGLFSVASIILLNVIVNKNIRVMLMMCGALNLIGALLTQTRGIWLGALVGLTVYTLYLFFKMKINALIKKVVPFVLLIIFMATSASLLLNFDVNAFVNNRLSEKSKDELVNPTTSVGYRVYESYMVYKNSTLFGHGSGATINLFTPFLGKINWWSIHSGYFDILHKYGFVGVFLMMAFGGALIIKSFKMMICKNKSISILGLLTFSALLNIAVVSITSGYFYRMNTMMLIVLFIGTIERFSVLKVQKNSRGNLKNVQTILAEPIPL